MQRLSAQADEALVPSPLPLYPHWPSILGTGRSSGSKDYKGPLSSGSFFDSHEYKDVVTSYSAALQELLAAATAYASERGASSSTGSHAASLATDFPDVLGKEIKRLEMGASSAGALVPANLVPVRFVSAGVAQQLDDDARSLLDGCTRSLRT